MLQQNWFYLKNTVVTRDTYVKRGELILILISHFVGHFLQNKPILYSIIYISDTVTSYIDKYIFWDNWDHGEMQHIKCIDPAIKCNLFD